MRDRESDRAGVSRGVGRAALVVWALLAAAAAGAKETDSFTSRYEVLAFPEGESGGRPIRDFTDDFNQQFRRVFAESLADLDRENLRAGTTCRTDRARRRLFRRLSKRMGGPLVLADNRLRPAITSHPNRLPPIEKGESIYRDFSPWGSISLGLAAKFGHNMASQFRFDLTSVLVAAGGSLARAPDRRLAVLGPDGLATSRVFRLRRQEPRVLDHRGATYYLLEDGQALVDSDGEIRRLIPILVSSDKFSHFFHRGLQLFKRLGSGTEEDLDRVMARNFWLEASLYGSRSTGVAAYADMIANFQGIRFWGHLLGRGLDGRPLTDPLTGEHPAPLVGCSTDGRWEQLRPPDIRDYLDPAWDEALNCSRLRSPTMAGKVRRRVAELERADEAGRVYTCPVNGALIAETAARYGRFVPRIINSDGHGALRRRGRASGG